MAFCGAVAWVYVNVQAKQAFGAMIGVAVALDKASAIAASEVFDFSLECSCCVHFSVDI